MQILIVVPVPPRVQLDRRPKHSPFRAGTILIVNNALSALLWNNKLCRCSIRMENFLPTEKGRRPSNGAYRWIPNIPVVPESTHLIAMMINGVVIVCVGLKVGWCFWWRIDRWAGGIQTALKRTLFGMFCVRLPFATKCEWRSKHPHSICESKRNMQDPS